MVKKKRFNEIVREIEKDPMCENLPLISHLICPVQRVMRYQLLLQVCRRLARVKQIGTVKVCWPTPLIHQWTHLFPHQCVPSSFWLRPHSLFAVHKPLESRRFLTPSFPFGVIHCWHSGVQEALGGVGRWLRGHERSIESRPRSSKPRERDDEEAGEYFEASQFKKASKWLRALP